MAEPGEKFFNLRSPNLGKCYSEIIYSALSTETGSSLVLGIYRTFMQGQPLKKFYTLDILSYTVSTQGPTMVGPGGKFSSSRSPDAW